MTLTVAQPDLALYRGKSDDKYDKNGKRVERSIYGRPWIKNESGIIPVTITLKGTWGITDKTKCEIISQDKSQTVLRFKCREGASFDVELTKL
jgi:chondroitin-sulfate-ABC endolyase/exolyase